MATAGGRVTAGVGMSLLSQHTSERNAECTTYVGASPDRSWPPPPSLCSLARFLNS